MLKRSLLATLVLLLAACSSNHKQEEHTKTQKKVVTKPKNTITLTDLQNNNYIIKETPLGLTLQEPKKKLLLVDIFATWCPPCQAEASVLSALKKKYDKEITILGISVEEGLPATQLQAFAKEFGAEYALITSNERGRILRKVTQDLKIGNNFGIPLLALYKDGKVIHYFQGAVEEEFLESTIKQALKK